MKSVLISIQPKWVEKIAKHEKTIEVRKTRPKIETPFKCYIYCTQGKVKDLFSCSDWIYQNRMRVIGEFVCDRIDRYYYTELIGANSYDEGYVCGEGYTCLNAEELWEYGKGADLFGWHISDLKIYDKPKALSEFYPIKPKRVEKWVNKDDCAFCKYHRWGKNFTETCLLDKPEPICEYTPPLERPPQSWCKVEDLGE